MGLLQLDMFFLHKETHLLHQMLALLVHCQEYGVTVGMGRLD